MQPTMIRILKHGLPTAVALFALGYLLSEMAAVWVHAQAPPGRPVTAEPGLGGGQPADATAEEVAAAIRRRVPLAMAGWGFALVAGMELLLWAWRRRHPAPPPGPAVGPPSAADVDTLLRQLLEKAEADRSLQAAVDVATPAPGCPAAGQADNSPTAAGDRGA